MVTSRGYIFIGLNAVRVLSIVALLLVFSSSIVGMVADIKAVNHFIADNQASNSTDPAIDYDYIEGSTVPNQPAGAFWAVVNRLLIIFQVIVLILAECDCPVIFDRYFPVLSSSFGLGALGIFQGLIGAAILSHHVDEFSLVAAFFLFSLGCVNMFLGLWREGLKERRSITKWRSDSRAVLPTHDPKSASTRSYLSSTYSGNEKGDNMSSFSGDKAGYGFGRQGEKRISIVGRGQRKGDVYRKNVAGKNK